MNNALRSHVDEAIRRTAIERFGAIDAAVSRMNVNQWPDSPDRGIWFVLSVKSPDAEWSVIGRRRTKQDLMQLAERGHNDSHEPR